MKKIIVLFLILLIPQISSFGFDCNDRELGLDFCYNLNYNKTFCDQGYNGCVFNSNNLPVEGQMIIYWPNISVYGFYDISLEKSMKKDIIPQNQTNISKNEIPPPTIPPPSGSIIIKNANKTQNLVLFYYLVDPSGRKIYGTPIFIDNAKIVNEDYISSPTDIGGIIIPSDYPGVWEINALLIDREDYLSNLKGNSFTDLKEDFNLSLFNNERVHILSYSEYTAKKLGETSLYVSIIVLIIGLFTSIIPIYREHKKQTDLLKMLSEELIFLEGNLKAYKKTFSEDKGYPLYELWNIDVPVYLKSLNHKINNKETIELKKNLMIIKDKTLLINNFKNETKKLEEERGQEMLIVKIDAVKISRNQIAKIIDEILPITKKSKTIIKNILN